jgi:hypothetical protein
MATKAEMQAAYERCEQIRHEVAAAMHRLDYFGALKLAESALVHQHAAVSFQRRFQNSEAPATPNVDLLLRFAPACFLSRSLDVVGAWYEGGTKTERSSLPAVPDRIAAARDALAYAVEIWTSLSSTPTSVLRLVPDQRSKALLHVWLQTAALVAHPTEPNSYMRVSDPRRVATAKCFSCGAKRNGPMLEFLEPSACDSCGRRSDFVLLRRSELQ